MSEQNTASLKPKYYIRTTSFRTIERRQTLRLCGWLATFVGFIVLVIVAVMFGVGFLKLGPGFYAGMAIPAVVTIIGILMCSYAIWMGPRSYSPANPVFPKGSTVPTAPPSSSATNRNVTYTALPISDPTPADQTARDDAAGTLTVISDTRAKEAQETDDPPG